MVGIVLIFDTETNEGHISGNDERIYDFHIGEWLSEGNIILGQKVYFEVEEELVFCFEIYFKRRERVSKQRG